MRPRSSSSWLCRAILTLAIYALVAASWSQSLSVAAQTGDPSLDGSPVSIVGPTSESVPPGASQLEVEAGEAAVPVTTLAPPVVITVDTSGLISSGHPCLSIDPNWIAVALIPLADIYWTSADESAGGNVFIDASTEPDSFSWDALGGGTIEAVIVPDEFGSRSATANFYDYRPFGGSIGGDAGLIAPAGLLTGAYLCLASPSTTSTATAGAGDAAAGDDSDDVLTSEGDTPESNSVVQSAAIGIGTTVRIAEPLNLRADPGLSAGVIAVLSIGTLVTVVGGPQTASGYTWWQLSTPSGTGWSVAPYLIEQPATSTPTSTPTRTPTRLPVPSTDTIGLGSSVRVKQRLNLRQAPGTSATVVTVMPAGTLGTVLDGPQTANGLTWWQVATSLGAGWAAGGYLEPVSGSFTPSPTRTETVTSPVATVTSTVSASPSGTLPASAFGVGDLVRTTTRINFRVAPGTQSAVLTVLATGSQGTVVSGPSVESGLVWWQLQTSSGTGWAAATYLSRLGVASTATRTHSPTTTPAVSSTRTPSATRTLTRTVTITLTPSISPTVGKCSVLGFGDIARTTSSVNFRSSPSTSGTIIRTLTEGERGTVRDGPATANGFTWCQIQIGSATGWVASQYLARVSGPMPTPNGTVTPRPDPPHDPGTGSASVVYSGAANSGMIALTYDAGAERGQAAYILDVLAGYGVKATFGMTGTWARDNPDLVARMVTEGHQLINHTWNHPSFTGGSTSTTVLTRSARLDQLDRAEALVLQQTGYQMKPYWRPPYGDLNASVLRDVYSGGYRVTVMWSCDTLGWNGASEQQILNRCMYPMGAGDIILMHVGADGLDWAASDNMIRYFLAQGLQIVTIEEMLRN